MSRGRGFTEAEVDGLLDVIEDLLPISPNDWDRVAERHCTYYPGLGRTRESLKRKFASLYNHKKPTGDPTCPATVHRAKQVWERIKEEMDVSEGERSNDEDDTQNEAVDGSECDFQFFLHWKMNLLPRITKDWQRPMMQSFKEEQQAAWKVVGLQEQWVTPQMK